MAENKQPENAKVKKKKSGRKKMLTFVIALALLLIAGAGLNFYIKYAREKQKQLALEEQRRREQEEKERQRRLLEEKRQEFLALIEMMKKYFRQGNFAKVRELSKKALLLADEHGFPKDEITKILHGIDVHNYRAKLSQLESMSDDIFQYLYVRAETLKIPDFPELRDLRSSIIRKTRDNEYLVSLAIARKQADDSKKGVMPRYNYMSSKAFLEKGISIRKKYSLEASHEEPLIMELQNELFFASKKLPRETIPLNIYR